MTASRRDSYMQRSTHTPQHPLLPSFWSNLYQKPYPHLPSGARATSIILFQSTLPNMSGLVHTPFSLNKYCFAIFCCLFLSVVPLSEGVGGVIKNLRRASRDFLSFRPLLPVYPPEAAALLWRDFVRTLWISFSQQCNLAGLLGGLFLCRHLHPSMTQRIPTYPLGRIRVITAAQSPAYRWVTVTVHALYLTLQPILRYDFCRHTIAYSVFFNYLCPHFHF